MKTEYELCSLEHFEAWLESKDPHGTYDPACASTCLVARYGRECLGLPSYASSRRALAGHLGEEVYEEVFMHAAIGYHLDGRSTFGDALKRLREARRHA